MAITRTDLTRAGAMRAFPKLSKPGALPLGQSVASIIASLPTKPGGFEAFILDDGSATLSVVLSHDVERQETVVVLYEKALGTERHSGARLLREAWKLGLVKVYPTLVAVAGSVEYGEAVTRMQPGFEMPAEPGMGGQHVVRLDMSKLGE